VADPSRLTGIRRRVDNDPASTASPPPSSSPAGTSDDPFDRAIAALDALLDSPAPPATSAGAAGPAPDPVATRRALRELESWLAAILEDRAQRRGSRRAS
jgi:hypothetical protein